MSKPVCECGSGKFYETCCGRYHSHVEFAPTAESLMRSRYTAYALGNEPYLLETWHSSTRPETLDLVRAPVQWLGLSIVRTELGGESDNEGLVEFVARCKPAGRAQRLHEASRFVRDGGRWYYVDGTILP